MTGAALNRKTTDPTATDAAQSDGLRLPRLPGRTDGGGNTRKPGGSPKRSEEATELRRAKKAPNELFLHLKMITDRPPFGRPGSGGR